jgi:urea transport system substrate-binding protein
MMADLQALYATLSGQAPIGLPSDKQIAPLNGRRIAWAPGLFLLALLAVGLFLWHLWQKPSKGSGDSEIVPPSGEPVKVGVLHSLTGTMADSESVVVDAVKFAIAEVNQEGGVLGRSVEPVVADGQSDPAVFAREAERLITKEKVCTVFGCWTSASRRTVRPIFDKHNHLLIYPVQFEGLEKSPCIVYLGAAPNQQILPAVRWFIEKKDKKRFFLVGSDYVFPHAANAITRDYLEKGELRKSGAVIVGEKYLPVSSQDVAGIIKAILEARPDMILNTINGDSNTAFFRALRKAGITPSKTPTLSFSVGEQELSKLKPDETAGDYAAWNWFRSIASEENQQFVLNFDKKHPGKSITDPMETAYLGVKLWAKAVNEGKSLEPKTIYDELMNLSMKGPGGDIRIDSETGYSFRTPRIGQVQADGRFAVVWTAPEPVAPEPWPATRTSEVWGGFLKDLYNRWGKRWAAPEK